MFGSGNRHTFLLPHEDLLEKRRAALEAKNADRLDHEMARAEAKRAEDWSRSATMTKQKQAETRRRRKEMMGRSTSKLGETGLETVLGSTSEADLKAATRALESRVEALLSPVSSTGRSTSTWGTSARTPSTATTRSRVTDSGAAGSNAMETLMAQYLLEAQRSKAAEERIRKLERELKDARRLTGR